MYLVEPRKFLSSGLKAVAAVAISSISAVSVASDDLFDLPLESLAQVIISASLQEEKLFDAPLAANVLTGEQISRSGATSIPEALRLVPGLIVRQQTNGHYDVHIRGLGNIPAGTEIVRTGSNNLTLVMIDNRVVYNHNTGGTFWEMLPVDINDVERIEVVKGAVSAMYGPNAVTGVIHILTKDPTATKERVTLHVEAGNEDTYIANGSAGFSLGNLDGRVSANWQHRNRTDNRYFQVFNGTAVTNVDDIITLFPGGPLAGAQQTFPDQSLSLERQAINFFASGELIPHSQADISLGYQEAEGQSVYDDNAATALTHYDGDSWYINLQNQWEHITARITYEDGERIVFGTSPFFNFDFENLDINLQGKYEVGIVTLQPLLQYRRQEYEGLAYNGDAEIEVLSAGLRSELSVDKFRFVLAVRGDEYDFSDDTETSFIFSASYKLSDQLNLRFSAGRAQQEPFMRYTFEDLTFAGAAPLRVGDTEMQDIISTGNQDLDVVEVDSYEFGLRWQANEQWSVDAELFQLESSNHQNSINRNSEEFFSGLEDILIFQYLNVPDEAQMQGLTLSANYLKGPLQASLFVTVQETDIDNNIFSDENDNTPDNYGGFTANYAGINKVNINVSGYWFDESVNRSCRHYDRSFNDPFTCEPEDPIFSAAEVDSKFLLNVKVAYTLSKQTEVFLNVRNALDDNDREYALADENGALYSIGFDWALD